MKLTIPVIVLFLFSSCVEHQYLIISGANINKTDNREFVSENDTLKVLYHFKSDTGNVFISVFNKTDEPLVIDWWKSAIIIEDKVFSYYNPNARLSAQVDKDTSGIRKPISNGNGVYVADVNGTVFLNETSQFIPSHAQISKDMMVFDLDTLKNLPEQQAKKDTIRASYAVFIPYRKMSFEKDKTPLTFRSYLTFRIGKANQEKEFSVEHKFYVSEVWKIKSSPQEMPERITSRGDMIYLTP